MIETVSFPFYDANHPLRPMVSKILREELYKDTDPSEDLYRFRLEMAETEDLQTLAMISNGIVVATSSVRTDTLDEPVSIIQNLAVDSKYKRMGFGAIALGAAEQFILDNQANNGLKIAKLDPTEPSMPFYTRMGYAPISDDSGFWAKVISK